MILLLLKNQFVFFVVHRFIGSLQGKTESRARSREAWNIMVLVGVVLQVLLRVLRSNLYHQVKWQHFSMKNNVLRFQTK
jgi:hypothetical protein